MKLSTQLTVNKDIVSRVVGEETVLLDLSGESFFGLNEVGTRVWELLAETNNLEKIYDQLLSEYDVAPGQLEADLIALAGELVDAGLASVVDPAE